MDWLFYPWRPSKIGALTDLVDQQDNSDMMNIRCRAWMWRILIGGTVMDKVFPWQDFQDVGFLCCVAAGCDVRYPGMDGYWSDYCLATFNGWYIQESDGWCCHCNLLWLDAVICDWAVMIYQTMSDVVMNLECEVLPLPQLSSVRRHTEFASLVVIL